MRNPECYVVSNVDVRRKNIVRSFLLWSMLLKLLVMPVLSRAQVFSDPQFVTETIATLSPFTPVGLAFAPDGRLFIWQKSGVVRILKNGVLLTTPFISIQSQVNQCSDRGLLGLALDPNFSLNGFVYLLYTFEESGNSNDCGAKVSRLTRITANPANPDVALAGTETVIFDDIPSNGDSHSVGTLRFAPDGKLFVSHGDGASYNFTDPLALRAQDLNSYNGKILRINSDGSAPGDNPFDDGTNSIRSKVWAYGLRNPFRFALHPVTGQPYIGDVGWNSWEEINRGGGANFGWPCYEGNSPQPLYQAAFLQCRQLPTNGLTLPLFTYDHSMGSTAIGGAFYTGFQYPSQYRGNLFFADYTAQWIGRMIFDANDNVTAIETFATDVEGPVTIEMGPDGMLYLVEILTGEVKRIRYSTGAEQPPVANASATPTAGYSPLTVNFSSVGSIDPEGGPLSYFWDFGDGATSTAANPQHTYVSSNVATFSAVLTVTDTAGLSASALVDVTVGSLAPVATIDTPADGSLVLPGQTVTFQGGAVDPEDGSLPSSVLSWRVFLHHNEHVHLHQTVAGAGGSFLVTDHGVGNFAFEIILTATDSSGLTDTKSIFLPMPTVGTPDVVAAYSFNEGFGNVANDSTGNGNDGNITGAVWTTGAVFGNALTFDGVNDFVSVADNATLDLEGTGTIEAWVRLNALGLWHGVIAKGNANSDPAHNYALEVTDVNRVRCILGNGTGSRLVDSTVTVTAGQFRHLACTWNGTTLSLYIDGVLNTSTPQNLTPAGNTSPLFIGQFGGNSDRLSGTIDEVRIYNRALTQAEIQFDMNTPIVTVANTAPTITSIAAQVTNEDTATGAVPFTVGDTETAAGSLTVSGTSSNTTLVPNGNIVFGGSGANRTVTVTSAANQNGNANITVTVSDGSLSTPTSFQLTVNAVNDAPTITSIANQTTTTGTAVGPLNFTVGDVETAAGSLTVSGTSSNTTLVPNGNIVFGGAGVNRTVTVTPVAGQTGTATITVTVSDGTLSTPTSFQLTVLGANTAPTISLIGPQVTNEDTATGAIPFTVGDTETPVGSLTVSGTSSNTTLVPNGNIVFGGSGANRTVTITPGANQSGTANITVTVSDGSLSTPTSFQLTVNPVNDAPTVSAIANQTTTSGTAVGPLGFTIGDVETAAASLTLSGSSSNTTLVPNANITFGGSGASRTVTVTPAANQTGTASITVTVSDGTASTPTGFQLMVNAVPTNLRAGYAFQEGSGTTTADASGSLNTGTLTNGPVWTTQGKYGNAITFDGANDFVSVPDNATLDLGATGTIEAWVRLNAINRWNSVIAKGNQNNDARHNYALEVTSANIVRCILSTGTANNFINVDSTITMTAEQFRHLACTWNGTTLSLYIDGALNASTTQNLTPTGNTSPLFIGQFGGNSDRLSGTIDEVRIYNRALTQAEIQFDMNTPIVTVANTAPTITSITAQVTNEDTATGAIPFTVGDTETPVGSLTVSGTSSNTTLVPNGNIVFGGSGANRTVTITPAANQSGTANITVTVSDGSLSTPTSFQLTVNPVNDAPTISAIANQTTTSGTAVGPLNFTVGDLETAAGSLTLSGSSDNTALVLNGNIVFGGSGANRTVTVTPVAGQTGTATITVTVSDGSLSTPTSFQLTVNAVPSGLRVAYAFQEGSGTTTVDGSGSLNTGTLTNGPVWTTQGKYGNAITFDGANDFVSVPDNATLDLGATGTIEAWVRLNGLGLWHGVVAKGNTNSDPAHNYALEVTDVNRVRCILGSGTGSRLLDSTITMTAGQFRHLACTWNGTTLSLYIDGALNASTAQNLTPAGNAAPLFIGQFGGNSDRLNGVIDEVRIYNRALTQAEIQFDTNTPIP